MTVELLRPLRPVFNFDEAELSNPGLHEAYSAFSGLRFLRCHQQHCEIDILDEVQRLDPKNPEVPWFRYLICRQLGRTNDAESALGDATALEHKQATTECKRVSHGQDRHQHSQCSTDDTSGAIDVEASHENAPATRPQLDQYEFQLLGTDTPLVDRRHQVNSGWQYLELLLEMDWQFHRHYQSGDSNAYVPLAFIGRLCVELRWESATTPLIVALGTHGRWNTSVPHTGNSDRQIDAAELGNHATRWLRATYRGTNIRAMIPKLTSDLLPPPAVDELSGE
jgi:hypothetical protein